ncbi:MAG: hypothetical protein KGL26_00030 [Pseudomonadota bacterium]|nr:hypothetical protein [Pseudomonadota bacterium]
MTGGFEGPFDYCICGLALRSQIALPAFAQCRSAESPSAVLRLAPVPLALEDPDASGPTWQCTADRFLLDIPRIARVLMTAGREILVEPYAGSGATDVALFAGASAVPILLQQQGALVLRASAVRVAGKAVLFAGASGAGKSVLAAALSQRGYSVLADDFCVLGEDGLIHPDGGRLKLWQQAIGRLDLAARRGAPLRTGLQKYHIEPATLCDPLPLAAIYHCREARAPHAPGISRIEAAQAPLALQRMATHPLLIAPLGQTGRYDCAAAALHTRLFHLTRRLDFALVDEVAAWLAQHWREIGLDERAP